MVDWMHKIKPSIVTGLTEFREIVKTRPEKSFPHVRVVRVGGNTVYRNDIEAFQNIFPNAMFANGLGLSEAGRVTEFLIEGDTLMEEEMLPLGYTLPGVTIRLLSTTGEFATSGDASSSESPSGIEVSPGEIGEVVIEDQYLADGYWHHSDLTAEKFRTLDNFNGARAYFTGDLAWQRTDGMLQHVGRMDDVIKIRGHQVFPNEIEALLRTVPGVNDVCVTGYSQSEGIMRLVAYLEAEHSDFHGVDPCIRN